MAALLPPDLVAMMARGVSVIVGSRDARLRPSIMRAVGSRVEAGGQDITVYLARRQSRQLVQDLAATGQVAVVFSEPSTHRSVQLKASRVDMRPAGPEDEAVLAAYLRSMEHEIQQVGFGPPVTRAMLAHRLDDVIAVRFTPEQAFEQTPGPRAGAALGGTP
ncbi:hypothetical protein H8N03_19475 [Ramlibacter sp. USB13]|uniref:Uncharacterized protein n=1 Tax=Ramlibacter cellulosilyticus TaxID=2764187 RepID=A0A923MWQ7_9BURK|nr:hypothetical protein [Ramlibacter cellulosilyticus]MBC5785137.1 hypothetical protein [Ramlibacter cellulosilyticus]